MDTHRKVRIVNGKDANIPNIRSDEPVVLVDGKLLYGVTRIEMDHKYAEGRTTAKITLVGVDVDLEAAPEYIVKVIGPKPPEEDR